MMLMNKVTVPEQVIARPVGEEMVILNLANGTYYGLDQVGARIWVLLSQGKTVGEICDVVLDEFEVDRERLKGDVSVLLDELAKEELIAR